MNIFLSRLREMVKCKYKQKTNVIIIMYYYHFMCNMNSCSVVVFLLRSILGMMN